MRTIVRPRPSQVRKIRLILGLFCLIWASLVFPGALTVGATDVSGIITEDTSWTKANSPYTVVGNIIVMEGVTLTIEPGVAVQFSGNFAIDVDGALIARGLGADMITFTPAQGVEFWGYLHFRNNSGDAVYDVNGNYMSGSILEYCLVEYGGGANVSPNGALRLNNGHPFINRCTVRHSASQAIYAWSLTGTLKITNCNISDNPGKGIHLSQTSYPDPNPYGPSRIADNAISGNGISGNGSGGGIYVDGGPGVEIYDNLIKNNRAGSGGGIYVGGYNHIISKNIIRDNQASGDGGGIGGYYPGRVSENVITGNTAGNNGGGCSGGGGQEFTKNIISDNTAIANGGGFEGWGYSNISNNSFLRNKASNYSAFYNSGSPNFSYNLISGNNGTGQPASTMGINGTIVINYNNICGNTANYAMTNENGEGSADIDGQNNWWGTNSLGDIVNLVYDWHLDNTKGLVDYIPYAGAIRTDPPISPPQGLKVTGPFTLNWDPNPEADVAGYIIYWGTTPGYPYANSMNVGNVTSYAFTGLPSGFYYLTVTAYDTAYNPANNDPTTAVNENQTDGHESWYSKELGARPMKMPWLMMLLDD